MPRAEGLRAIGRRSRQVVLLAAVTGATTGLFVAAFERLTSEGLLTTVKRQSLWVQGAAPMVGLLIAAAALRWLAGGATASTADEYIKSFHDRNRRMDERPVVGRIVASIATLGFGGALGYEGPSIYIGSAVGTGIQRRLSRFFGREDAKVLLVCGAAAGVSAIFKAPATGIVFALEVPYQDDLARRMLLPAAISSAASYVVFAALAGTSPLLPVRGVAPFNFVDLGGAALIGLLCGFGARLFVLLLREAKRIAAWGHPFLRALAAGAVLAGLFASSRLMVGESLTLGPGYDALRWALDPHRAVLLVLGLFLVRAVAAATTIAGGGAGGLFIPLVIEGALVGRAVSGLFASGPDSTLFPVIGIAAFLGAGYRVPLASVMFVAEFTGRPGFVVPGLIAAVIAQLVMGRTSASAYQVASQGGHLERRFALPLSSALQTDVMTLPPDATVSEFFWQHLVGTRQQLVPVVEGNVYLGMAHLDELTDVPREDWETTAVCEIMRTDLPVAQPSWLLRDAILAMEEADVDRLPVCDAQGGFIGVISSAEIIHLDAILGRTEGEPT